MVLGVFALCVVMYGLTRPGRAPPRLWRPVLVPAGQPTTEGGDITRLPTFKPPPDYGPVTVTENVEPLPMNKRVPLMCTVNNAFGPSDMLPPDGMCDAIFYDSLYRDGRNALTGTYDAGLEHFLELGQGMQFTGIGVSFDVHMNVGKFDVRSPDVTSGLLKLWNRGVTHFGALRVYGNGTGEEEVIAFLSFLQVVESTIQERMSTSRHYTVLGVSYNREASYENVIRHMKNVYKPFLYVVVLQVPYLDKELLTCLILPPTLLDTPQGASQPNLSNVMEVMRHIQRVLSHEVHIHMAISFTLRARLYKPADLSGNDLAFYKPLRKCQDYVGDSDISPTSVCKDRYTSNFNYFGDRESAFTFDPQEERTVTYDTQITIKTKVCKAKMAYPDLQFGIAAFDVNLDIADTVCNNLQLEAGNFTRLSVLSKMDNYISNSATTFQECMNVA